MVANLKKHRRQYLEPGRWLPGRATRVQTGITKRHKVNPGPEKYLNHTLSNQLACIEVKEDEITRLEKAVLIKDARTFESVLRSMDWKERPPLDFLQVINLALRIGAYTDAQYISALGKEYHSDDKQIQKCAFALAPPKVTHKKASSNATIAANRNWVKEHGDEYHGKWVGLRNGELLDSDDSFDELIKRVGSTEEILITTVF